MTVTVTVRPTVTWEGEVKCDKLLHGRERLSLTNCYMGGRGEVQLTVTWEGEVQCDPTVTWEGEVQCDQLLHGRER